VGHLLCWKADCILTPFVQDPLSALDAHVRKAVFQNIFLNNSIGKTGVLVTHALHFLPQVDYILTMMDGQITEQGSYVELMANNGEFSKFIKEFGSKDLAADEKEPNEKSRESEAKKLAKHKDFVSGSGIIQAEERVTGAVSIDVYGAYIKAGKGYPVLPFLFLTLALIQGAAVMSSYWSVIMRFFDFPF
jgi:ABC-type methionine transport system ATPase subunit